MTIELTVGVSASGKTTYAEEKVSKSKGKWVNLNRDDIRATLFCLPAHDYRFTDEREGIVTKTQLATADAAMSVGKNVIISDTNLDPKRWEQWKQLAKKHKVPLTVSYFSAKPSEIFKRNISRARSVPESVIRAQIEKFETNFPEQVKYFVPAKFINPERGVPCWIVDVDGTLAHMNGKRGAFDWKKVGVDDPDEYVITLVNTLYSAGNRIILMSGRSKECYTETAEWLRKYKVKYDHLYMRDAVDFRHDTEVKEDLFNDHVATKYKVMGVLDDRNCVVEMWRRKGLKVLQVELGEF